MEMESARIGAEVSKTKRGRRKRKERGIAIYGGKREKEYLLSTT
jgi:hypothetical protein